MSFSLPELPYAKDALEPHMSATTFDYHHGKHHATYVKTLNGLIEGTELVDESLEGIIKQTHGNSERATVFNNAAQVWNHTFFWNCLSPKGGGKPQGDIAAQIDQDFGSYEAFAEAFISAGKTQFGSGWAWLVWDGNRLEIMKTPNADLPMVHDKHAILTCDVWEHAYYLDYQNRRPDYLSNYLEHLVNWDFANENLHEARQ